MVLAEERKAALTVQCVSFAAANPRRRASASAAALASP